MTVYIYIYIYIYYWYPKISLHHSAYIFHIVINKWWIFSVPVYIGSSCDQHSHSTLRDPLPRGCISCKLSLLLDPDRVVTVRQWVVTMFCASWPHVHVPPTPRAAAATAGEPIFAFSRAARGDCLDFGLAPTAKWFVTVWAGWAPLCGHTRRV